MHIIPGTTIRVLLVDDSVRFLDSLVGFLSVHDEVQVVGRANSASEAAHIAQETMPDLILMDYSMPGSDGLEATRRIKAVNNPPKVIILTMHESEALREASAAAGAEALVSKHAVSRELLPAILQVYSSAPS